MLAACALSRIAHGEPLAVRTSGTLPFSAAELGEALSLRAQLSTAGNPRSVLVDVSAEGANVNIELAGRRHRVALDGERGESAARLVAFAILDLAGDQLDPPTAPHEDVIARAPIQRSRDLAWSIAVWGATGTHDTAAIEVGAGVRGPVRVIGAAGASRSESHDRVTLRDVPVRLGLAWRIGAFDVRATAIGVVETARAQRATIETRFGGGASVTVRPITIGGFAVFAGVGGDVFADPIDYRINGEHVASTERVAWWAGIGVGREVTR